MVLLVERAGVPAWLASALGAFVGAQVAFVGHALLTFSVRPPWGRAWGRFQLTAAGGALLGMAIVAAGVRLGWHYLVAQGVATALVLCTGFVLNARWTFGAPRQGRPTARKAAPAPRPPR
jgi:putative flippase GtrA